MKCYLVTLVLLLATIWGHATQVSTMSGQPIKVRDYAKPSVCH